MTKYRIREENYNGISRFYVEQKGLFFWYNAETYDPALRKKITARFWRLSEAKAFVRRLKAIEERANETYDIEVKYHEV